MAPPRSAPLESGWRNSEQRRHSFGHAASSVGHARHFEAARDRREGGFGWMYLLWSMPRAALSCSDPQVGRSSGSSESIPAMTFTRPPHAAHPPILRSSSNV